MYVHLQVGKASVVRIGKLIILAVCKFRNDGWRLDLVDWRGGIVRRESRDIW